MSPDRTCTDAHSKQIPDRLFVINDHVQVGRRDADVGVPSWGCSGNLDTEAAEIPKILLRSM